MDDVARRLLAIKSHPKYFLKYATFTKDGNDLVNPCKPFPYNVFYHQVLCDEWYNNKFIIVPKSRQMQVSWSMLACFLWLGLTGADREIYFRRQTFDDALKLLEDMRYIYDHIPSEIWPRELLPEMQSKEGILYCPDINTTWYAISSGRDKMRGRTPTGVLLDEFSYQDDASMVLQTILPAARGGCKVAVVSTYKPIFAGEDPTFNKLVDDRI